jgi:hypothetical protein
MSREHKRSTEHRVSVFFCMILWFLVANLSYHDNR